MEKTVKLICFEIFYTQALISRSTLHPNRSQTQIQTLIRRLIKLFGPPWCDIRLCRCFAKIKFTDSEMSIDRQEHRLSISVTSVQIKFLVPISSFCLPCVYVITCKRCIWWFFCLLRRHFRSGVSDWSTGSDVGTPLRPSTVLTHLPKAS